MVCDLFELKQNVPLPLEVIEIIDIPDEYDFAYSIDCRSMSTHRQSHTQELYATIENKKAIKSTNSL